MSHLLKSQKHLMDAFGGEKPTVYAMFAPIQKRKLRHQLLLDLSGSVTTCFLVEYLSSKQVLNAVYRQKQLGYYDRCHSSSRGPKGMSHLEAGRPQRCSEPAAWGWLAPSLRQPTTSWPWPLHTTSVFNLFPFFLSLFDVDSCIELACQCKGVEKKHFRVWENEWVTSRCTCRCLAVSWILNTGLSMQRFLILTCCPPPPAFLHPSLSA